MLLYKYVVRPRCHDATITENFQGQQYDSANKVLQSLVLTCKMRWRERSKRLCTMRDTSDEDIRMVSNCELGLTLSPQQLRHIATAFTNELVKVLAVGDEPDGESRT
jgi:hypothetical protein